MPTTKPRISFNLTGRRWLGGRYSCRQTGPLTREELDVAEALRGFCAGERTDYIAVKDVWRAYTWWWSRHRHDWVFPLDAGQGQYPRLTIRQLGRAVRRLFPGVVKVKRCRSGKAVAALVGSPRRVRTFEYRGLKRAGV